MNRMLSIGPILLLLGLAPNGCNREVTISESEAKVFGEQALASYCSIDKLSPRNFRLKEIGPAGDFPWMLVYVSSGIVPAQEVVVSISKNGSVESSSFTKP